FFCAGRCAHEAEGADIPGPGPIQDWRRAREVAQSEERAAQAQLLRDIFYPFHNPIIAPTWLAWEGGTVVRLAEAAYQERALPSGNLDAAHLGVLADALEEAGCDDKEMLTHLRQPGPHVRGCWAVDSLLGKE